MLDRDNPGLLVVIGRMGALFKMTTRCLFLIVVPIETNVIPILGYFFSI